MGIINVNSPPREIYEINITQYYTASTSLKLVYTLTMPISGYLDLFVKPIYNNAPPTECCICTSLGTDNWRRIGSQVSANGGTDVASISGCKVTAGQSLYIYTAHTTANTNFVTITGRLTGLTS